MNPNPFDQDGVIRILLEEANMSTLKTLRELNTNWNSLDLKELEKRASEGEFREYDFSWGCDENNKTEEEANEYILNFLESTSAIPQLFCDFRFNFPESLKILNASFFNQYPPIFIHLKINEYFFLNGDFKNINICALQNILRLMAPTLKELGVGYGWSRGKWIPEIQEIPGESQLVFPKLNKFTTSYLCGPMLSQFRIILDKGGALNPSPNLKKLSIMKLSTDLGHMLGMETGSKVGFQRWSSLTYLHLFIDNIDISKTILHLPILAQYGMNLIHLSLNFRGLYGNLGEFCGIIRVLSHFFESQSQSLQYLGLSFSLDFKVAEEEVEEFGEICQISLPIFPKVFKLNIGLLHVRVNGTRLIPLQMETFPFNFPKLTDMEITYSHSITDLFARVNLEPLPLRELVVDLDGVRPMSQAMDWLRSNFSSVLRFGIKSSDQNNEIPWEDSLEFLQLFYVNSPIKLAHLTHLKTLVVLENFIGNSTHVYRKSVHSYLEYFQEVVSLNLTTIHFQSAKEICNDAKGYISSYFPYSVEFKARAPLPYF